jgi:enterobactin synthetase component F
MALWGRLARPGDPAARHGQYLDLRGGLDRDALTAAIQCAIAETPALALRLADPGCGPRQATGLPPMPGFADLSAQPDPVGQALAQMRADLPRPLDLAQEPAGALALFVISRRRHLLFLRADALALDACGMACLTHRIALHYAELLARAPARPEPEPAPETEPAPAPEPDRGPESQPPAGCDPDPAAPLPADLVRSIERLAQERACPGRMS